MKVMKRIDGDEDEQDNEKEDDYKHVHMW
jgi:hypothetical protein